MSRREPYMAKKMMKGMKKASMKGEKISMQPKMKEEKMPFMATKKGGK
jgi:hypothetical protein